MRLPLWKLRLFEARTVEESGIIFTPHVSCCKNAHLAALCSTAALQLTAAQPHNIMHFLTIFSRPPVRWC